MSQLSLGAPQQKVLLLTGQPEELASCLAIMPDVMLMPLQDVMHDKVALRERVADSFMASQCDVIILDSRQPLDLATICRTIRGYPAGKDSHLLVMTCSEQDWATCMSLNVDDVVRVRPNEPVMASLATVMARYMRALAQRQRLEEKSRQAQTAIEIAAEYGSLLHFMDAAEKQQEINALAQLMVRHLGGRSYDAIVQISVEDQPVIFPPEGAPATHYTILAKLTASQARTAELDRFVGFRHGVVTMLVTNAPYKDPEKYGNLKDYLAHLSAISDTRARNLMIRRSVNEQHARMISVLDHIHEASQSIHDYTRQVMTELGHELEVAAGTFDMPAEDEARLLVIANTARDKLDALSENRDAIESHFGDLVGAMGHLKNLIDPPRSEPSPGDDATVELF